MNQKSAKRTKTERQSSKHAEKQRSRTAQKLKGNRKQRSKGRNAGKQRSRKRKSERQRNIPGKKQKTEENAEMESRNTKMINHVEKQGRGIARAAKQNSKKYKESKKIQNFKRKIRQKKHRKN